MRSTTTPRGRKAHRTFPRRRVPGLFTVGMTCLFVLLCLGGAGAQEQSPAEPDRGDEGAAAAGPDIPLYDDLGDLHRPITTDVAEAQAYFDQGLRLYYAFNHREAVYSFREAQRLDPDCAMCWWGEALAWGPNINLPMDSAAGAAAWKAVQEARARAEGESPKEQALIDALSRRYREVPRPDDRAGLDSAYAEAMGRLAERYPADDDVRVLYAESIMDLRPWDYWTADGELQPGMSGALAHLEAVQERSPEHPGACHFFIHAVEKEEPERAVACAERLAELMPGAGHIVHMPGHIYIRVGRYLDAIETNEHAAHADESWIRDRRPRPGMYTAGYYPHNYDFLAFAALMAGRGQQAVDAADELASLIPEEMLGAPGMTFTEHYSQRSLLVRVRFARWDEILAEPAPPEELAHARAVWRYARGRALAATGDPDAAEGELEALRAAAEGEELRGVRLEFNPSQDILAVAVRVLAGRIAEARGRWDEAVGHLREGARLEDALLYGEPPEWTVPVRQELGEVLLAADRPAEAGAAFRAVLDRFPANGWSLHGLARALEEHDEVEEAREVRERFRRAWREATTDIDAL